MKLDRMIGILSVLLQNSRVTAPELARHFEVSRRTINRDIDALCRAGIPIASRQGVGGGFSIMEGYSIDRRLLTHGDLQAILAGLRSLDSVSGTRRYRALMEKLSPGGADVVEGDGRILIDLASWYGPSLTQKMEILREAIDSGRSVRFDYWSPSGDTRRTVEPGWLVFRWSSWYLWGWCRARREYRLFKLNRMTDLSPGEPCAPREIPPPDLSNDRLFPTNYTVEALVAPKYRWRLIEEYGPESFETDPDGRLRFRFGFTNREHALTWALSFAGDAELIEPADLRKALREIGLRMADMYEEDET